MRREIKSICIALLVLIAVTIVLRLFAAHWLPMYGQTAI
jgi:hypothetical protein